MSTFTKIIVGDDGLEGGRDAAALARALRPGAEVVLASAYPWDATPSRFVQLGYGTLLREDTEEALARRRDEAGLPDARIVAVGDSSPARALHRLAATEDADLIVVGSAHHGSLGRLLAGDVGRGVLHGAPCAVLVAPRGYAQRAATPASIGVAYDGSAQARHALEVGAALAADLGATLTVRQAVATEILPALGGYPVIDVEELSEEVRQDAQKRLDALVATLPDGLVVDAQAVRDATRDALGALAGAVDLLVCGSRGWGAVRRVVLGSTSDHLVHHAPCPVLVVPGPASEEDVPGAAAAGSPETTAEHLSA